MIERASTGLDFYKLAGMECKVAILIKLFACSSIVQAYSQKGSGLVWVDSNSFQAIRCKDSGQNTGSLER